MRILKLVLRIVATLLLVLLIAVSAGWGVLALYYSGPQSDVLRTSLAVLFGLLGVATLTGLALRRWRRRALGIYLVVFTVLVAWWSTHRAIERPRLETRSRGVAICHSRR